MTPQEMIELARVRRAAGRVTLVDVPTAAAITGIPEGTIRAWISTGHLPAVRAGRTVRVDLVAVAEAPRPRGRPRKERMDD